jgi:hypothetical protein
MKFRLRHMNIRIAATFRKKPVEIQAERIEAEEYVDTLEGRMRGNPGDWKVTGVKGEQYFVAGDIFPETYEPVDAEAKAEWERVYDVDA